MRPERTLIHFNRENLGFALANILAHRFRSLLTVLGIIGSILVLGVITGAFLLLVQYRQKKLRLRKGNFFLLLNVLFVVWGVIQAINYLVEMILFFEFVYLLDFLTLLGALALPSVLLQLSDRKQGDGDHRPVLFARGWLLA